MSVSPIDWGCGIHGLYLCKGLHPASTKVLDMTLNDLMVETSGNARAFGMPKWEKLIGSIANCYFLNYDVTSIITRSEI